MEQSRFDIVLKNVLNYILNNGLSNYIDIDDKRDYKSNSGNLTLTVLITYNQRVKVSFLKIRYNVRSNKLYYKTDGDESPLDINHPDIEKILIDIITYKIASAKCLNNISMIKGSKYAMANKERVKQLETDLIKFTFAAIRKDIDEKHIDSVVDSLRIVYKL